MKEHPKLRYVVIVCAIIVLCIVCVVLFAEELSGLRASQIQRETVELKEQGKRSKSDTSQISTETPEDSEILPKLPDEQEQSEKPEPVPELQADFQPLYEENEHVVGWLKAGKLMDYPVVQADNDYYLRHNFYGKRDSNGAIFMDMHNCLYPRDEVLLVYGHRMKSGAMFGTLDKYMDYEYLCEYPVVTFRTIYDEEDVFYTPIAAFRASMTAGNSKYFDITRVSFGENSADYQAYLDELQDWTMWEAKVDATTEDQLLMLVTCNYDYGDGRFLLVCRKLRENETPEDITALYAP